MSACPWSLHLASVAASPVAFGSRLCWGCFSVLLSDGVGVRGPAEGRAALCRRAPGTRSALDDWGCCLSGAVCLMLASSPSLFVYCVPWPTDCVVALLLARCKITDSLSLVLTICVSSMHVCL